MDELIKLMFSANWQTIVALFLIGWFYTKDLKSAMLNLDNDMREQGKRTDKLYEMFCKQQEKFQDEMKILRTEMDKKFYDLLNEGKK